MAMPSTRLPWRSRCPWTCAPACVSTLSAPHQMHLLHEGDKGPCGGHMKDKGLCQYWQSAAS